MVNNSSNRLSSNKSANFTNDLHIGQEMEESQEKEKILHLEEPMQV